MKASTLLLSLALAALPFSSAGCFFDGDDDDDDTIAIPSACVTECEDGHTECSTACTDDACVTQCDTVRDTCKTDCD
jgi:hypothetical protein